MRPLAPIAVVLALAAAPALTNAAGTSGAAPVTKPPAAAAKPTPSKATPEQRAEAERLPALARAAFWAREVDTDPKDPQAELSLSRALRDLGRFDEAAAAADQLLVFEPNNYDALLESARDRVAGNQGFYAIESVEHAAALQPRDWRPVSLLAVALEQAHRDDDALTAHQKALALAPDNPATLTNLGMYFASHGAPEKAEPLLRKAAEAPGATAQERQNLALVLGLEGRYDDAARLARQDLPPDQVDNNLAYLHADAQAANARSWASVKAAQ